MFFPLSDACSSILSNTPPPPPSTTTTTTISNRPDSIANDMTYTIALALRNGILSVLPEVIYTLDDDDDDDGDDKGFDVYNITSTTCLVRQYNILNYKYPSIYIVRLISTYQSI